MYRLPSPFNAKARNSSISAAGGGSTTTTCSCCVVTAGVACIATSIHFAGLAKPPVDDENQLAVAAEWTEETETAQLSDGITSSIPHDAIASSPTLPQETTGNKVGLALMGFFALPLIGGAAAASVMVDPGLAILVGVGGWIALFAMVYSAHQRKVEKGIVAAIVGLLGIGAALALELAIWFGVIFN